MKIAHIIWAPKIGGAELFAYRLAQHMAYLHDVRIIYLGVNTSDISADWSIGVETVAIGCSTGFDIFGLIRLRKYLLREKFDVIHHHQSPLAIPFIKSGSRGALLVKHEHGRSSVRNRSFRQRLVGRYFKNTVDLFIANSNYTKEKVIRQEGISEDKLKVVRGGVDTEFFVNSNRKNSIRKELGINDEAIVLFLGRLVWEKGIEEYFNVASQILEKLPETRFVIVGDGPLRHSIETRAESSEFSGNVYVLGFRRDVADIMMDSSLFLMTSRMEAQGLTVIEAMACGLPVVSFDEGGLPEIVGNAGVLVDDRSVDAMSNAAIDILSNPDYMQKLVEKGRNHARYFTYESVAERILNIYEAKKE